MNSESSPDPNDRKIIQAILCAGRVEEEIVQDGFSHKTMSIDANLLVEQLQKLDPSLSSSHKERLVLFAEEFCRRYRLRVLGPADVHSEPTAQSSSPYPAWVPVRLSSMMSTNLLSTRLRTRRTCMEAARESAYFGYGQIGQQVLPNPVAIVRAALAGEEQFRVEPLLLEESGPVEEKSWSVLDLLEQDEFFQRSMEADSDLTRFQQRLREDPLDGNTIGKLRAFFSKKATVGIRDTTRWALGARHPWFDWQHARGLIESCFERFGTENFLSPRMSYYCLDATLDDDLVENVQRANLRTIELFAIALDAKLDEVLRRKLSIKKQRQILLAAFDCYYDNPDPELETKSQSGVASFLDSARNAVNSVLTGPKKTKNDRKKTISLRPSFERLGYQKKWLADSSDEDLDALYQILDQLFLNYLKDGGILEASHRHTYERLPYIEYTFIESVKQQPKENEERLDSFSLAELTQPQHAHHLKNHPEVFEKLVVFFTLVLRHYLDTNHVPDLRPNDLLRDFLVLGLWGTNTPNLVINLYKNTKTDKERSEIRFVGLSQLKDPGTTGVGQKAPVRTLGLTSLLDPLLEPSVLRSVGTFLMAADESLHGTRVQQVGTMAFARQTLELFRETARTGVKGTLVDLATLLEILIDNTVDAAQRGLDRVSKKEDS